MVLPSTTASPPPFAVVIERVAHHVTEGGRRRELLAGASAAIEAGESVALLGPSGSGKSTLLNLVAGIDLPDAGVVYLAGQAITALAERERTLLRRHRIGIVFQAFNLVPTLTVAENIGLALELNTWPRAAAATRVDELLAAVGLVELRTRFPGELSGGEQQRVAVARAVAHRPAVVLADEPTGNLDGATGAQVLDLLFGLCGAGGGACLIVTHSAEVAARADRRLHLIDGHLREERR